MGQKESESAVFASLEEAMRYAVALSQRARGVSTPNPPVGAVLLDADGKLLGEGTTQPAGQAHAEIMALADARARGQSTEGATAVVTLEPCNHHGRTGPCSQALAEAGVARVVYAVADPLPQASGGGQYLVEQGVEVHGGCCEEEARSGPLGAWLHRQRTGRPRITLKWAATLDGLTAAPDGTSQWITGTAARAAVHEERARVDAILVGTGTALADNPRLTARTPAGDLADHQPLRVVVGHRGLPESAALHGKEAPTLTLATRDPHAVVAALGAGQIHPDQPGSAPLPGPLLDVQIEGGATLAGAFLAADLVDRIEAYVAPMLLGSGRAIVEGLGTMTLREARRFRTSSVRRLGEDVLITAVRHDTMPTEGTRH